MESSAPASGETRLGRDAQYGAIERRERRLDPAKEYYQLSFE